MSAVVTSGGAFDNWDLEIRGGLLGRVRVRLALEEHGAGRQLLRLRAWPVLSLTGLGIACMFAFLALVASMEQATIASGLLDGLGLLMLVWSLQGCVRGKVAFRRAVQAMKSELLDLEHPVEQPQTHQARAVAATAVR